MGALPATVRVGRHPPPPARGASASRVSGLPPKKRRHDGKAGTHPARQRCRPWPPSGSRKSAARIKSQPVAPRTPYPLGVNAEFALDAERGPSLSEPVTVSLDLTRERQWQVSEPSSTGHVSSYGILRRSTGTTLRASGSNPKFRMRPVLSQAIRRQTDRDYPTVRGA